MDDLISRQDVLKLVDKGWLISNGNYQKVRKMVESLPSAEPEIILCKDCRWFGRIGCAIKIVDDSDKPKENDFCSFAERKQIGSKLEIVEKSMLVAYEPEEIKQKSKLNADDHFVNVNKTDTTPGGIASRGIFIFCS